MKVTTSKAFESKMQNYPKIIKSKMLFLRALVIETAHEIEDLTELEETLKWGEPSFLTKNGSTLRMDWKEKKPTNYAMYFKCTSKLVETFKQVFNNTFTFESSRAIVFSIDEKIPKAELKKCIKAALTYHKIKKLPNLGF